MTTAKLLPQPPVVILGCGYVGTRLAQSLLADGVQVRVCARRVALLEPLRALGAEVHYMDASRPHQFGPALLGLDQPVVVYSIPGVPDLPQGEAIRRAATAAQRVHARGFVYLGSSAVYGRSEVGANEDWVDEESSVASGDPDASARLADEAAVQSVAVAGLRTVILRLSAIYGPALGPNQPARGVRQRLRSGDYKLWDGGRYYFSRIYIDDLVRVIRIAAERAPAGAMYVVGDDRPCTQGEYGRYLAAHLRLPPPVSVDSHQTTGVRRQAIRGHRLKNERMKRELGFSLLYPSYREGESAIDVVEQSGVLPALRLAETPAAAPAAPVEAPAPLAPWPRALPEQDLGTLLGKNPTGLCLIEVPSGQALPTGPAYLVVSGQLSATHGERLAELGPLDLVPEGATGQNLSAAPVLLVRLPR